MPASISQLFVVAITIVVGATTESVGAVFARDWKTPGDGLLTYDEVSRHEWLDLSVSDVTPYSPSYVLGYQAVINQMAPGGAFAGFVLANRADLISLAASAGIDTSTFNYAINQQATFDLIELVGLTYISNADTNRYSMGFVSDPSVDYWVTEIFRTPSTRDAPLAGVRESSFIRGRPGVWLYREVPEPKSILLLLAALCGVPRRRIRKVARGGGLWLSAYAATR